MRRAGGVPCLWQRVPKYIATKFIARLEPVHRAPYADTRRHALSIDVNLALCVCSAVTSAVTMLSMTLIIVKV